MATTTIYRFDIQLADADRDVYETLPLRVVQQPSETAEFMWTRVLAYCLEYLEGLSFGPGLAEPDEPALAVRDLTGTLQSWIDIGTPDAARLHKASKAVPRVVVYTHKDPSTLVRQVTAATIHRSAELEIYAFDRPMISALTDLLERRMHLELTVTDGHMFATIGETALTGTVTKLSLG